MSSIDSHEHECAECGVRFVCTSPLEENGNCCYQCRECEIISGLLYAIDTLALDTLAERSSDGGESRISTGWAS